MEETKIIPITTPDEWSPEIQRLSEWINTLVKSDEGKKKLVSVILIKCLDVVGGHKDEKYICFEYIYRYAV